MLTKDNYPLNWRGHYTTAINGSLGKMPQTETATGQKKFLLLPLIARLCRDVGCQLRLKKGNLVFQQQFTFFQALELKLIVDGSGN